MWRLQKQITTHRAARGAGERGVAIHGTYALLLGFPGCAFEVGCVHPGARDPNMKAAPHDLFAFVLCRLI